MLAAWESSAPGSRPSDEDEPEGVHPAASDIVFGYFRRKALIDYAIASFLRGKTEPGCRRLLSAACFQMKFQSGIAPESAASVAVDFARFSMGPHQARFVNAILRRLNETDLDALAKSAPENVMLGFPSALYGRWASRFDAAELGRLSSLLRSKPPLAFRASPSVSCPELEKAGCRSFQLEVLNPRLKFFLSDKPQDILRGDWLRDGLIYVQDPAAALAPSMLAPAPGELVLDICSAPGGKTLVLEEICPAARILSSDRSLKRQKVSESNFRLRGRNIGVVCADALKPPFREGSFDAVLADVPCSNTGVFRRKPDGIWRFSEARQKELVELQAAILASAARLVRPGGRICYSTCSLEPDENIAQVERLIGSNPAFRLVGESMLMPTESHDGSFAAVIERL